MTDAPSPPLDYQKWTHELNREDAQRAFDLHVSRIDRANDWAVKAADGAFRASLLINGGAAVSVLAFIGSLATKELIAFPQLSRVAASLEIFAFGVAAAVAGIGLSYLTHLFEASSLAYMKWVAGASSMQRESASERYLWLRNSVHGLAVVAFLTSIGCFIGGMLAVREAIEHLTH
jgi:hypothetical protein